MIRLILAATLGSNYGIYGPAYELCENVPFQAGSEEYLNSEKYEIKHWDLSSPVSLQSQIARVNGIRKENQALQSNRNLTFHTTDNPFLICYSKRTDDSANIIVTIVNLDPFNMQFGFVTVDLAALGIDSAQPYQIHDLLGGGRYTWSGSRNYVELSPGTNTAHIFRVLRG
jgi:starch synthase (maltosyl-transferring)